MFFRCLLNETKIYLKVARSPVSFFNKKKIKSCRFCFTDCTQATLKQVFSLCSVAINAKFFFNIYKCIISTKYVVI